VAQPPPAGQLVVTLALAFGASAAATATSAPIPTIIDFFMDDLQQ
jgi:hypothetical protein